MLVTQKNKQYKRVDKYVNERHFTDIFVVLFVLWLTFYFKREYERLILHMLYSLSNNFVQGYNFFIFIVTQ